MWLIIGLGNPGRKYAKTRHNLGYMVIDAIALKFSISLKGKAKNFVYGRGIIEEKDVLLIKPITFMNRSGTAVKDVLRKFQKISAIIVIHDDLDLDTGVIRIKKNGSSGGHKGIESIIQITGTKDFLRLKIGIGRPEMVPPEDYVLSSFPKREQALVKKSIDKAVHAIETILNKGVSYTQNAFH